MKLLPHLLYEKKYWKKGYRLVVGVDEVGRGAFAGPVVAGAVAIRSKKEFLEKIEVLGIDDSKKLSALKREKLSKKIKKYFHFGIGESSVGEINRLGIVKATERAMRRAIKRIMTDESEIMNYKRFVLVDAFYVKYIPGIGLGNQKGIVHGDSLSVSIAAASILAKVYRDEMMRKLSKKYIHYKWFDNKGYGTLEHRKAIEKYGICKLHREKFVDGLLFRHNSNPCRIKSNRGLDSRF